MAGLPSTYPLLVQATLLAFLVRPAAGALLAVGAAAPPQVAGGGAPAPAAAPATQPVVAGFKPLFNVAAGGAAASATDPHFTTGTYGMLRASGARVRFAVQRVLGVQGSLDDLKEDLSTEYKRWQARRQDLTAKRQQVEQKIQRQQAKLLKQRTLREQTARLRGDLALARSREHKQNETQELQREKRVKRLQTIRKEIRDLLRDIEGTRQTSMAEVEAIHNHTAALRSNDSAADLAGIRANQTTVEMQASRSKHAIVAARAQGALLDELSGWQEREGNVSIALQAQGKLQFEHEALAAQAREVLQRRENLQVVRETCDTQVQHLNAEVTASGQAMQTDTEQLRRCQQLEAQNAQLQSRASECRAARRSGEASPAPAASGG